MRVDDYTLTTINVARTLTSIKLTGPRTPGANGGMSRLDVDKTLDYRGLEPFVSPALCVEFMGCMNFLEKESGEPTRSDDSLSPDGTPHVNVCLEKVRY